MRSCAAPIDGRDSLPLNDMTSGLSSQDVAGARSRTRAPAQPCPYHYILVRADTPRGVQIANACHAAGESGPARTGTSVVVLVAPDEVNLRFIASSLTTEPGLRVREVVETHGKYRGHLMAVGVSPTFDRAAIQRYTAHLPLAFKEAP